MATAAPATCPEVAYDVKSIDPYRLDKLSQPHALLAAVVRREATLGWLKVTRRGIAAPASTGLPPSAALQQTADGLLLPGGDDGVAAASAPAREVAIVSSRGKAFDTLLSMADQQEAAEGSTAGCSRGSGVAGRYQASLQLYLALSFLSVDVPVSLERQLAARVRARGVTVGTGLPEPRYSDDACRALQLYRDAAVAGAAYWDHACLLVALVHEVGPCTGMVLEVPFHSHNCGCGALCIPCSSLPQVILGDASPEIFRPLLAAFEEGLWPSSASSAAPHATPAPASFRRSTLYLTARELFPKARSVPSAVAAGSARSSSGTPLATGVVTPCPASQQPQPSPRDPSLVTLPASSGSSGPALRSPPGPGPTYCGHSSADAASLPSQCLRVNGCPASCHSWASSQSSSRPSTSCRWVG